MIERMAKHYDQYCPVAHALVVVGDRWALLVARELMQGPKRYTDLAEGLLTKVDRTSMAHSLEVERGRDNLLPWINAR